MTTPISSSEQLLEVLTTYGAPKEVLGKFTGKGELAKVPVDTIRTFARATLAAALGDVWGSMTFDLLRVKESSNEPSNIRDEKKVTVAQVPVTFPKYDGKPSHFEDYARNFHLLLAESQTGQTAELNNAQKLCLLKKTLDTNMLRALESLPIEDQNAYDKCWECIELTDMPRPEKISTRFIELCQMRQGEREPSAEFLRKFNYQVQKVEMAIPDSKLSTIGGGIIVSSIFRKNLYDPTGHLRMALTSMNKELEWSTMKSDYARLTTADIKLAGMPPIESTDTTGITAFKASRFRTDKDTASHERPFCQYHPHWKRPPLHTTEDCPLNPKNKKIDNNSPAEKGDWRSEKAPEEDADKGGDKKDARGGQRAVLMAEVKLPTAPRVDDNDIDDWFD